jgi:hypothetical protein
MDGFIRCASSSGERSFSERSARIPGAFSLRAQDAVLRSINMLEEQDFNMSNNQISGPQTATPLLNTRDFSTHGSNWKLVSRSVSSHQPIPEAWKHLNANIAPFSIEKCRDLK